MRKSFSFLSLIFASALFILFVSSAFSEESITLTTYYPAPYGVYAQMSSNKLVVDVAQATPAEFGAMAAGDAHIGRSLIVGASGTGFSYQGGTSPQDGDVLIKGKVGIGTTAPNEALEVKGKIKIGDAGTNTHYTLPDIRGTADGDTLILDATTGDLSWASAGLRIYKAVGSTDIGSNPFAPSVMDGMSITQNFPAGNILIIFNASIRRDIAGGPSGGTLRIRIDGSIKIVSTYDGWGPLGSYTIVPITLLWVENFATSGMHTIDVEWAGPFTQKGSNDKRILTVITGQ